jgi:hypothetical protein
MVILSAEIWSGGASIHKEPACIAALASMPDVYGRLEPARLPQIVQINWQLLRQHPLPNAELLAHCVKQASGLQLCIGAVRQRNSLAFYWIPWCWFAPPGH